MGRRAELASLEGAVADARNGAPSVVLVGGEAGIGKSTLISEVAIRTDVPLHLGRCVPMGGDIVPLAPLADLLRRVRRSRPDVLEESSSLTPLVEWLAPGPGVSGGAGSSPGDLFALVLELVTVLSVDGAIAVGFEDLHWADTVTWDLFEFLARNLIDERIVLIGTHRSNEISTHPGQGRRLAELSRQPIVRRLELQGLDRDDVTARVTALMGDPASVALVDDVLARGQGNPFFTEELVAAHQAGEAIPAVLSDLISADIADLDDEVRDMLGLVAVVGRETGHELLCVLADVESEVLESAVRRAVDAQVLVVDDQTGGYRFRHALIGEVAYSDLLPSQRTRLHRRVADALREQSAEVLSRADRAGELAFHLDRAGEEHDAFAALLLAADAAEVVAPGAALRHLERAFELWDAVGPETAGARRSDRMWQAAEISAAAVSNERAVELARAAFVLGPPPEGEARGHERLGRYLWGAGQLEESGTEVARSAALLADDDPEAASVFAGLAQAELMAGRYDAAEGWYRKAVALVPDAEIDPLTWVTARRVAGVVSSSRGHVDEALAGCRDAVAASPTAQARALAVLYLGNVLLDAGQNEELVGVALDSVSSGRVAGLDGSFGGYSDALAAEALTRLGRWSEAEALLVRHEGYDTLPVGAFRIARAGAMLAVRRGDTDRARQLLADARSQPLDGWHLTYLEMTAADLHLLLGEWDEASAAAERGRMSVPLTRCCGRRGSPWSRSPPPSSGPSMRWPLTSRWMSWPSSATSKTPSGACDASLRPPFPW